MNADKMEKGGWWDRARSCVSGYLGASACICGSVSLFRIMALLWGILRSASRVGCRCHNVACPQFVSFLFVTFAFAGSPPTGTIVAMWGRTTFWGQFRQEDI